METDREITTEESIFLVELINNYILYYREYHGDTETLFDNIDTEDLSSTNFQMEKFYEMINEYKQNEIKKNDINNIYDFEEKKDMMIEDEVYCIYENDKPIKISVSFFSLLIELTNIKNDDKNDNNKYKIIKLK